MNHLDLQETIMKIKITFNNYHTKDLNSIMIINNIIRLRYNRCSKKNNIILFNSNNSSNINSIQIHRLSKIIKYYCNSNSKTKKYNKSNKNNNVYISSNSNSRNKNHYIYSSKYSNCSWKRPLTHNKILIN